MLRASTLPRLAVRFDGKMALVALAALVGVAGSAGLGTGAAFTRAKTNAADRFQIAVVDLQALPSLDATTYKADGTDAFAGGSTTEFLIDNVVPGDSFTRYIKLHNGGTVPQSVSMAVAATDTTGTSQLVDGGAKSFKLKVSKVDATLAPVGVVYDNGTGPLATTANQVVLGDTTPLAVNGDQIVKIELNYPSTVVDDGTAASVQGKSATLQFTWQATQIAGAAR